MDRNETIFLLRIACADPESFVRGDPTLTIRVCFLEGIQANTTITGPSTARQRDPILIAFCWRADDGPL